MLPRREEETSGKRERSARHTTRLTAKKLSLGDEKISQYHNGKRSGVSSSRSSPSLREKRRVATGRPSLTEPKRHDKAQTRQSSRRPRTQRLAPPRRSCARGRPSWTRARTERSGAACVGGIGLVASELERWRRSNTKTRSTENGDEIPPAALAQARAGEMTRRTTGAGAAPTEDAPRPGSWRGAQPYSVVVYPKSRDIWATAVQCRTVRWMEGYRIYLFLIRDLHYKSTGGSVASLRSLSDPSPAVFPKRVS